jgi:hypothetical protein
VRAHRLPARPTIIPNPHIKIGVDPGRWENSGGSGEFAGGSNGLGRRERAEVLIPLDAAVKLAEKRASVLGVVFPSIFAIEKKANGEWLIAAHGFSQVAHAIVEIGGSGFGVQAAVNETDEVGEMVIAKQSANAVRTNLHVPWFVKAIGVGRDAVAIAEKSDI